MAQSKSFAPFGRIEALTAKEVDKTRRYNCEWKCCGFCSAADLSLNHAFQSSDKFRIRTPGAFRIENLCFALRPQRRHGKPQRHPVIAACLNLRPVQASARAPRHTQAVGKLF